LLSQRACIHITFEKSLLATLLPIARISAFSVLDFAFPRIGLIFRGMPAEIYPEFSPLASHTSRVHRTVFTLRSSAGSGERVRGNLSSRRFDVNVTDLINYPPPVSPRRGTRTRSTFHALPS